MSETVIQVTSLGKRIKVKTILEDISFEINQGDCVALIGPNGAGKTVLMSCILGDKKHSSGQVLIEGKWNSVNILDTFWEENLKASALRLLDPFYDQFPVLYRGLVIQFLLNSSFIIKYDVIFDNICYTISSYVSSLMEREGFRLEN